MYQLNYNPSINSLKINISKTLNSTSKQPKCDVYKNFLDI